MLRTALLITLALQLCQVEIFARVPKNEIFVEGVLSFQGQPPKMLPPGSCIWYRLYEERNTSAIEERKLVISYDVKYVGYMNIKNGHRYRLPFPKLSYEKSKRFRIAADLFVGRCPHINFIKEMWNDRKNPGDYSTRYAQKVEFKNDIVTSLQLNLQLSYFCWKWQCGKYPVTTQSYCYDITKQKVIPNGGSYKAPDNCDKCSCMSGRLICQSVKCDLPKNACSKSDNLQDDCCPCDIARVKGIKWTVTLQFLAQPLPEKLPLGSCLTFKVKDKFTDIVHAEMIYVGGTMLRQRYELFFDRKGFSSKTTTGVGSYNLMVTLNYGWCPKSDMLYKPERTVEDGDYRNEKPLYISMSKSDHEVTVGMRKKCTGRLCKSNLVTYCIDDAGKQRPDGSEWQEDSCTSCRCIKGQNECVMQTCQVNCSPNEAISKPGECCPTCPAADPCYDAKTNTTYKDGERWRKDSCVSCICYGGFPMCSTNGCMVPNCPPGDHHVVIDGLCCPVCSSYTVCEDKGLKYVERSYWQKDDCKICRCTRDGKKCFDAVTDMKKCSMKVQINPKCKTVCLPPYTENEP